MNTVERANADARRDMRPGRGPLLLLPVAFLVRRTADGCFSRRRASVIISYPCGRTGGWCAMQVKRQCAWSKAGVRVHGCRCHAEFWWSLRHAGDDEHACNKGRVLSPSHASMHAWNSPTSALRESIYRWPNSPSSHGAAMRATFLLFIVAWRFPPPDAAPAVAPAHAPRRADRPPSPPRSVGSAGRPEPQLGQPPAAGPCCRLGAARGNWPWPAGCRQCDGGRRLQDVRCVAPREAPHW